VSGREFAQRVSLFGAPLDSGNRGVEALGRATLDGVLSANPYATITLYDNGWGLRRLHDQNHPGADVELCGVRHSRRLHRPESWARVRASQRLHLRNPVADRIRGSGAVLDISGGDSFSDVYGTRRLKTVLAPKHAALRAGRPLVLLPQTYGPYMAEASRRAASQVVRRASMAWSRDADSHEVLLGLLGADADPRRHRLGVDVAFALDLADPGSALPEPHRSLLAERDDGPVVGVNVSGLLVDDGTAARRFGLRLDYLRLCVELVSRLVADGARVLLIPHVRDRGGAGESDRVAAETVLAALDPATTRRVLVVPDDLDARQVKWVISRCDWFCGARMHATIAALSTGVPVAAVAYTMKFRGVFATCGVQDQVVEARSTSTDDALVQLLAGYSERGDVKVRLGRASAEVVARARAQIADAMDLEPMTLLP
jgi:colanic acid/amylovoran biosynthesis protein